jgi:hypothetical protein
VAENKQLTPDDPGDVTGVDQTDPVPLREVDPDKAVDPPAGWQPVAHDYSSDPQVHIIDDDSDGDEAA